MIWGIRIFATKKNDETLWNLGNNAYLCPQSEKDSLRHLEALSVTL